MRFAKNALAFIRGELVRSLLIPKSDQAEVLRLVSFLAGIGWSILVAALCLGVAVAAHFAGQAVGDLTSRWVYPLFKGGFAIAGITFAVWLVRVKLNKAPWKSLALPSPKVTHLLLGGVCSALAILFLCAIQYRLGWLHVATVSMDVHKGVPKTALILLALVPSLGTGLNEELCFRGYIFRTLGERAPVWVAALSTGVIFAFIHFSLSGFGVQFIISVIIMSTAFLAMRFASGSLWFPIGFHALWDWTQTYLVGLSFSGQGYDPSLVHVIQSGPAVWVGGGDTIESGLLYRSAIVLITIVALLYARQVRKTVPWTRRLNAENDC
jgi:hypothetical protein